MLLVACASGPNGAPVVTYSNPSVPKASREPLAPFWNSPTHTSFTSVSALPSNVPRATVMADFRPHVGDGSGSPA